MELSSEIPRTILEPSTLQVNRLDGNVKYLRGCSTFTAQEELVQEGVKSVSLEEIPVSIEKVFQEPGESEKWKVPF